MMGAVKGIMHFEGIPGSGKSTASERLCQLLVRKGVDAYWSLEESADHPVMPKEKRRMSRQPDFPEICLDAWRSFVDANDSVAILDGYALQNTVRYLFANLTDIREISEFFRSWQAIADGNSALVFFTVANPIGHYEKVLPERGEDWTAKLFAYVERTPFGQHNGLRGRRGFVDFWSRYQDVCLNLLESSEIPVQMIEARSWSDANLVQVAADNGFA